MSLFAIIFLAMHAWEDPAPGHAPPFQVDRHSWEEPEPCDAVVDGFGPEYDSSDDEHPFVSPGTELVDYCLNLFYERSITAQQLCIIMHWSSMCDIAEASPLAKPPGAPSGHYQRHLEKTDVFDTKGLFYNVSVPGYKSRSDTKVKVLVPHEELERDVAADRSLRIRLREMVEDPASLPPCYWANPIVRTHGTLDNPVFPMSIFVDGVAYSDVDTVVGFWVVNEVNGQRRPFGLLRKKCVCSCGCRGWCNFREFFSLLLWSQLAMARGEQPSNRHDDADWCSIWDSDRAANAGKPMLFRYCLLYFKGDWSEYASTLGLTPCTDGLRPCWACNTPQFENIIHGIGRHSFPYRVLQIGDYEAACQQCEITVVVTQDIFDVLVKHLAYDVSNGGALGLALTRDIAFNHECMLQRGDRIEPTDNLRDVAKFCSMEAFPVIVTFWRRSRETFTRRRNPYFNAELGTDPAQCLVNDSQHALYLGQLQIWGQKAMWQLLPYWSNAPTQTERQTIAVARLNLELQSWYKQRHRSHPSENLTEVHRVTAKMVGEPSNPKFKFKAAETWGLTLFLVDILGRYGDELGPDASRLLAAGQAVRDMCLVFDTSGRMLGEAALVECWNLYKRFCALTPECGHLPKRHQILHLLKDAIRFGNPRFYANWTDESKNHVLKRCCRTVAQARFEERVLLNVRGLTLSRGTSHKRRHSV